MEVMDAIKYLQKSLSKRQRNAVLVLADECKVLGTTSRQLAPLFAALLLKKPTKKEAKAAWDKIGKKNRDRMEAFAEGIAKRLK
jgi:hypothetical protein